MAPNDFWLFPKIKFALKERRFQDIEDTQKKKKKKSDNGTDCYSTTGVSKTPPTVAASLG
jgi:hypothetical protein